MWKSIWLLITLTLPEIALGAGLVPCGGAGEPECQACYAAQLLSNLTGWLVLVMGTVAVILIAYAGLRMVVSMGDVSAKQYAKTRITNLLFGYAVLLSGWLFIDTLLKFFVDDQVYGVWNEVKCEIQPVPKSVMVDSYFHLT